MTGQSVDDIFDVPGNGGRRAGSGRKRGYSPKRASLLLDQNGDIIDDEPEDSVVKVATEFAKAKARKESALADHHQLAYKIKSGQYVERAAVQAVSATLLATLAQNMRSIPDNLERKFNLSPEAAEFVESVINSVLADVAEGLAIFSTEDVHG